MQENWIIREARKVDEKKDIIILEKPDAKAYLESLLLMRFWPVIRNNLEGTSYTYSPQDGPEIDREPGQRLEKSLTFMFFEERKSFFRGKLSCAMDSWFLTSEFFLMLSRENIPLVVLEILGNSRLRGNPPELTVDKSSDGFYWITFHAGNGKGWGISNKEDVDKEIKKIIDINAKMYELSKGGIVPTRDLGEFLSVAYEVYEAF